MDANLKWHADTLGEKAVVALKKNKFSAVYFADRESVVAHVLSLAPDGASVGFGGSMTVRELQLKEKLAQKGCLILDHRAPGLTQAQSIELCRKQLTCQMFLAGSNAVTLNGELVNVDGTGNRVGAMTFGPEMAVIVVGTNKIVKDLDEAQRRIEMIAGPVNNKRLGAPNPCTQTGQCADCKGETRICNVTVILRHKPVYSNIHVVIVGENLGY